MNGWLDPNLTKERFKTAERKEATGVGRKRWVCKKAFKHTLCQNGRLRVELLEENVWIEPPPARLPEIDLWRAINGEELLEEDRWIEPLPVRLLEGDTWRGTPGGRHLS
ncbi:hypothetical protein C8J57DRAFT_1247123 [Mycena rebaudengoi]|nr:hypothetical protein C8J57DRAFT_1247123 [Mycena rebaudengoi]